MRVAAWNLFTLLPNPFKSNPGTAAGAPCVKGRCYHHKRNETSHDWPRFGHRSARCRAYFRAAPLGPRAVRGCSSSASSHSSCRLRKPRPGRRPGGAQHDSGRAIAGPRRPLREPRPGWILPPLSPRGRHSLARSQRRLFSFARRCLRCPALARGRSLPAHQRPQVALGHSRCRSAVSLPRRQFVLAGKPPFPAELAHLDASSCLIPGAPHRAFAMWESSNLNPALSIQKEKWVPHISRLRCGKARIQTIAHS